jgi:hypothetical protein
MPINPNTLYETVLKSMRQFAIYNCALNELFSGMQNLSGSGDAV